jgi:hypothetical protein
LYRCHRLCWHSTARLLGRDERRRSLTRDRLNLGNHAGLLKS